MSEKDIQKIQLLLLNTSFQKSVKEIREEFCIPFDGFKIRVEDWEFQSKFIEETKRVIAEKDYTPEKYSTTRYKNLIKELLKENKLGLGMESDIRFNEMRIPTELPIMIEIDPDTGLKRLFI